MSAAPAAPIDRRSFLKWTGLAAGGLALAYYIRASGQAEIAPPGGSEIGFAPSAFLRIGADGKITIYAARPEIGQGIKTSLPMILAEELGANWKDVTVVSAPFDEAAYGPQGAGGSTSTPGSYEAMRLLGASARLMLVTAAAQSWGVPESECTVEDGVVRHQATGRTLGFGQLAAKAAALAPPSLAEAKRQLKDPNTFALLGSRVGGVDNPKVVTGQPLFGIDQRVPGMLYAVYVKCPVWGGRPLEANLDDIKALPGVRDAFVSDRVVPAKKNSILGLVPGVAIVGDSTWAVFSARRQLEVRWDQGSHAGDSWSDFAKRAQVIAANDAAGARTADTQVTETGDVKSALASATHTVEGVYSYAFLSHATLEPQNCTVHVQKDQVEVWAPTQAPGGLREIVAEVTGVAPERIKVTVTRSGGGFGRRLDSDPAAEAALVSLKVGAPVKLMWDRTADLQHDHYRPGAFHFLKGAVDATGRIVAWRSHNVHFGNGYHLGADDYPHRFVPNVEVLTNELSNQIPQGPWRAPHSNTYAFVVGSFLDELAHAAGRDPIAFNLDLLGTEKFVRGSGPRSAPYNAERMRGVIRDVALKSGWAQQAFPRGRGAGFAYYFSHQGYFAEVAEVTVSPAGALKVDRVVVSVDVGSQIVNLSGAENQIQGSIIDGLSAAWRQELDIRRGRVVQANFDSYQLLRLPDAPAKIEISYCRTNYPPTGLGEPALPPIAPAVANAVFAATGIRIRQLPFAHTPLAWT